MGDAIRVSLVEALAEYTGAKHDGALKGILLFVALADISCSLGLYGSLHKGDPAAWEPVSMLKNLFTAGAFTKDSADLLLLLVLRLTILPLVAFVAARKGKPPDVVASQSQQRGCFGNCMWKLKGLWARVRRVPAKKRGILTLDDQEDSAELALGDISEPLLRAEDGTVTHEDNGADNEADAALDAARKRAVVARSFVLAMLFALSTVMQVYIGVKCISFRFGNEGVQGTLMGVAVLWLNVLVWVLREMVTAATKEEGFFQPQLHPHRLHPLRTLTGHYCDVCSQRMKGAGRSYRCKLCDFDLCKSCFSKKDKGTLEGVLRGDKGVRTEESLSTMGYFKRALGLSAPEWQLGLAALFCLALTNGSSLALPNFQGAILDSVVRADKSSFSHNIVLYLTLSIITGLVGGFQSLCFLVIGRKMANAARNKLFRGIISQDMAFFDGNKSGSLTSQLSQDVSAMVSPCTTMLGTLFSSTVLLFGGCAMCFATSWRLSMLAFTSVGPIIHITQAYAGWSRRLNREIYAALGEANSFATEALINVRTVKAFSTEKLETNQYETATKVALEKGVKDAFGGAGAITINQYLDLSAGLLILWYGGSLAMADDDRLTAGKLISYQLYWNLINSSYQQLVNIVTSFTRAAGAAQRVFTLMDSLPDIDIDKGTPLVENGAGLAVTLENVRFAYQMRPDWEVLKGINLHIPPGTTCALVGRSGGGKSTLIHLMLRFYDPKAGRILVNGAPLEGLQLRSLHKQTALVSQDTQLFGCSILENITYGMDEGSYTFHDVVAAATKASAHEFISGFPDGYKTRVGERGARLSGGQKQRIAIARALLRRPRLLLLDEATSALDAESEASVQAALDSLMREGAGGGSTIVLVAHRLSTVINATNIAVVDGGEVMEQGSHESLLKRDGLYAKLVSRQLARQANVIESSASDFTIDDVDTIMKEMTPTNTPAMSTTPTPGATNTSNGGTDNHNISVSNTNAGVFGK